MRKLTFKIISFVLVLVMLIPCVSYLDLSATAQTNYLGNENRSEKSDFTGIEIGEYITLGTYFGEPILWRCVDIDENGPLMLSDKILCFKAFDAKGNYGNYYRDKEGTNNWRDSCLRHWLNSNYFVDWSNRLSKPNKESVYNGYNSYDLESGFLSSFSLEELALVKDAIQTTYINDIDSEHADGGSGEYYPLSGEFKTSLSNLENQFNGKMYQTSVDKFFAIDLIQAQRIYQNLGGSYLTTTATISAIENYNGPGTLNVNQRYKYWLRDPGTNGMSYENVMIVDYTEEISFMSASSLRNGYQYYVVGVRPAFYLNLEDYNFVTNQSSEYSYLMGNAWKKAGMENIYEYLTTFPSIPKAVIDSYNSDQTFIDFVAGWKFMEYMFEPGNTVNDALNMKDYYTAILLSLIDAEIMDENYIKSIEESSKFEYAKLYRELSNIIKSCGELDHEKLLSEGTCSVEEISILNNKINSLDNVSKKISDIGSILSTGKTINDSINLCINYYNICNTSQYIINVLRQMKTNGQNMFLSMAIDDIVSVSENSFDYVTSGFLAGSANAAKDYGVDKINDAWEAVLNSTTLTKGALLGYKIGKPLSNIFLSTDSIISNYFEFMALYEVEKALKSTIVDFEADFYNKVDADSSLNYINAVALYFKSYYLAYDYAVDLAKYSKLCPFAYIFYNGKQSFEKATKQWKDTRTSMKTYEDQLFGKWSYSLKESYPKIYDEIAPSLGNLYSTDLSTALVRLEYLSKTYTGHELRPSVTVSMGNAVLLSEDYTVTYYNNIEPGLATVKIKASEGSIYTGEKTIEFIIKELPFVKRVSIRGTIPQRSMFNLCDTEDEHSNSGIVLPDVYFYEGDEIVASVENGTITNDDLPIFITENGIDILVHDKNYIVEISGSSEQTYNTEIQKLDEKLSPIETSNYNNLSLANGIQCNINSTTGDEIVVNNEILQADFSTNETTEKQQYKIYSEQCVVNDYAYENQRVYISAIIPEGNIFVGWSIFPQVLLSSNKAVSSFIMPSEDVYISAGFMVNQAYFDLKDAISEASAIEQNKYTKSSYDSLKTIIEECKSVLTNDISEELSQEKIALIQTGINALEEITPLSFNSASLTLQDDLVINYKVDISSMKRNGYENPYVIFNFNGVETIVTDYKVMDDKYVFDFENINPYQMNDTIYATLYATNNGLEYAGETREYSVATYCYNMLSKYSANKFAEFRTLLVDLLNYGAASQVYMNYKTDDLVNAKLTDKQKAWGTSENRTLETVCDKEYAKIDNPTVTWKGAGLNLEESIGMRFKIETESIEGLTLKVSSDNGEWTIDSSEFIANDGVYYVFVDGMHAGRMSEVVYLTFYNGDDAVSNTIRYSIESYAYSKQNDSNEALVNLLMAMMKYGDSVKAAID